MARQPIAAIVADPGTPPPLRESLLQVQRARAHAASLGLDVGGHYTSYVPWARDRLITTIVATRPGSIEIVPFSYPILGDLPYKGFFSQDRAEREASRLRAEGLDVCVSPVAAYSTLGWWNDPVTTPMLQRGEGPLVETLVHELVHASVFVNGDPEFNESIATFVGEEASLRYFKDPENQRRERDRIDRKRAVSRSLLELRNQIARLYTQALTRAEKARKRRALEEDQRTKLAEIAPGNSIALNDACLALHGTYSDDLSAHEDVLEFFDGDLHQLLARLLAAAASENPRQFFRVKGTLSPPARP